MLALITAALTGLASIPKILELLQVFIDEVKKVNADNRIAALEAKSEAQIRAFAALAKAQTEEEKDNAIRDLSKSVNG